MALPEPTATEFRRHAAQAIENAKHYERTGRYADADKAYAKAMNFYVKAGLDVEWATMDGVMNLP